MTIIHGQVFDPHGRPESEATIFIVYAPVSMPDIALLTDADGRFILSAPVPGHYILGFHSESWGATQKSIEISGEDELVIEARFASTEGLIK